MNWSHLFFGFDGRISRKSYWIAMAALFVADLVPFWISYGIQNPRLGAILDLALLYPTLAVLMKRTQDRDVSHWPVFIFIGLNAILCALNFFGLAGPIDDTTTLYMSFAFPSLALALYLTIDLGFRKGMSGPNRFGADPLQRKT